MGRAGRSTRITGWQPTAFVEPYLEVGPDGVVWVTDPGGNRVLLFDSEGRSLGTAAHEGPLATPLGIALVDATHAVVANAGSHSLAAVWRTARTSVAPDR